MGYRFRQFGRAAMLLVLLVLLALDCFANFLHGGSISNTLSSEAWHQRDHKYWGFAHRWIDWLFACPLIGHVQHCKAAADREHWYGSAWSAWLAAFQRALQQPPPPTRQL